MAVFETWLSCDLKQPVQVKQLSGNLFSADNGGNKIGVVILDGGQVAGVSGTVTGYVIREDGGTVVVNGTLSGNRAHIVLPLSAYAVPGRVSIVIKLGTTTIGACTAYVYRTMTDTIVDPAHVVPSLNELLAKIGDCENATAAANSAATNANNKASLADTKAGLANTKAELADQKATAANNAANAANAAAGKIDGMTAVVTSGGASQNPSVTLTLENGHYVLTFANLKGQTGEAFHIVKTYASIAAMQADFAGTDTHEGDFVMISSNVEDPDNAKVYVKGASAWGFVVDMSGATGIQGETGAKGDNAYVHFKYAASQPTQDSDMKDTADAWMGVYGGFSATAPTTYTSYTWFKIKGETGTPGTDGTSAYVWFRFAASEPTQDSDMKTEPDAWIGIYAGDSPTPPTTYTSYTWYKYKGETGQAGANAYMWFRFAASEPTQDSDMKTEPDQWLGIYSGPSSTAPTTYTSYAWYKIKGEAGSIQNANGETIPISGQDNTSIKDRIGEVITEQEITAMFADDEITPEEESE